MRIRKWHKAFALSIAVAILVLIVFHDDYRVCIITKFSKELSVPKSFSLTNEKCTDTIQIIDWTINRLLAREHLLGGANIAITKDGRLVYAKGYGYSNLKDSIEMQPYNIMRVASVSKLITAVAVMRLAECGKLFLNQRVFGPTGVLCDDCYRTMRDSTMKKVTVRQLLNHSGGWTAHYGDPMFMQNTIAYEMGYSLPINMKQIIKFMQTKHMHFRPGSVSIYSNFGYGILGEVVGKAAGMPYEDYVRSEIFAPLGIYDAHLGYSHIEDRLHNEVFYYEQDTSSRVSDYENKDILSLRSYGGTDIHTLGSAGGWVLNAVDLAKMMLVIDGFSTVPDILSSHSITEMTDSTSRFAPLGWRKVVENTWYRTGTLQATSAILCRRPDGICFVVVLNNSNSHGPNLALSIAKKMNDAINKVHIWPKKDLLSDDIKWSAYKKKYQCVSQ